MEGKILFVSDSRGRDIDAYLNYDEKFECNVARGATMRKASDIAMRMQRKKPKVTYDLTVISAGICNLTKRTTTRGTVKISYTTNKEEREAKLNDITHCINRLRNLSLTPVSFCTIIPASIKKHNNLDNETSAEQQQQALLEDIRVINSFIKQNNREANIKTIDWARFALKHSKKRRRTGDKSICRRTTSFTDENLEDGVHFNDTLKQKCFTTTHQVALDIVRKLHSNATETEESTAETGDPNTSQESIQPDSWDHKRARTSKE